MKKLGPIFEGDWEAFIGGMQEFSQLDRETVLVILDKLMEYGFDPFELFTRVTIPDELSAKSEKWGLEYTDYFGDNPRAEFFGLLGYAVADSFFNQEPAIMTRMVSDIGEYPDISIVDVSYPRTGVVVTKEYFPDTDDVDFDHVKTVMLYGEGDKVDVTTLPLGALYIENFGGKFALWKSFGLLLPVLMPDLKVFLEES